MQRKNQRRSNSPLPRPRDPAVGPRRLRPPTLINGCHGETVPIGRLSQDTTCAFPNIQERKTCGVRDAFGDQRIIGDLAHGGRHCAVSQNRGATRTRRHLSTPAQPRSRGRPS